MTNISVIVTTYNRPKLLKETLESILNQTYVDFELIVVDNNSNYDFFKLIELFNDNRIIAYQNDNNGIIAVNRNFGIRKAKGKYIAFCDDDDLWIKTKLQDQLKLINNLNENILIHSNTILFGENIINKVTKKFNISKFEDFYSSNPITYSSVMLTNNDMIFFDEDPSKKASEDFDLWIKLLIKNYKIILINQPLVKYRISSNSAFRDNYNLSYLRSLYVLYGNILEFKLNDINYLKLCYISFKFLMKFAARKFQGL
jgi:teichuronic acid biosynthesis glycosyltransferase TuaG